MYIWFTHTQSSNMLLREQFWNRCGRSGSQALRLCSPIRPCHWLNSTPWRDCRQGFRVRQPQSGLCNQAGHWQGSTVEQSIWLGFLVGQDIQLYPEVGWGWRLLMLGRSLSGLTGWTEPQIILRDWVDSPAGFPVLKKPQSVFSSHIAHSWAQAAQGHCSGSLVEWNQRLCSTGEKGCWFDSWQ